ncbi:DEAD/DEAH box helicase [Flavobacterium pectinovorum]|uniref:AAA domain-containing protein n=1 Tax=Flavobacterium pectinovorum TaxID=29533 RepID=A0ABY1J013_9FLAO|nr:ATP-binding protein [Flavobacterium pectinovorum]SHL62651.1 AAA domain-containing protein [Flavobacterium pectinovorum]
MKQKDILEFWRNIEIFNLPDFNNNAALLKTEQIFPWVLNKTAAKKNYVLQHTLIFGRLEKKKIVDQIDHFLNGEITKGDWEETISGYTCLSALILDQGGRPDEKSYVTASFSFGINALIKKQNLSVVYADLEKSKEDFEIRYNIPEIINNSENDKKEEPSRKGDIISWAHLNEELDYLHKQFDIWNKEDIKIYMFSQEVPKDNKSDTSFLNSFYLSDLNYLCNLNEKEYSKTLKAYLNLSVDTSIRKDIILDKNQLFASVNPKLMQAGRWPSNIDYSLYTAQLGAVNDLFSENEPFVKGINGPPGTGKTTLLLDVISDVIVNRAKVIAKLGCRDIFEGGYNKVEKENGFNLFSFNLKSDLQNNFGIVIASNNNSAVENITKELPAKEKIDCIIFPDADYFSECSERLISVESWGTLAAALGNNQNRHIFKNAIWKSDKENQILGLEDLLYNVYKDKENDSTAYNQDLFEETRKKLKQLHEEFESFINKVEKFHNSLPVFIEAKNDEIILKKQIRKTDSEIDKNLEIKKELDNSIKNELLESERIQNALTVIKSNKPSFFFFQKLFGTKSFKEWKKQADLFLVQFSDSQNVLKILKKELSHTEKKIKDLETKKNRYQDNLKDKLKIIDNYQKLNIKINTDFGIENKQLFTEEFHQLSLEEIHLRMPYYSPKIAKLRSDIFIQSLNLHKYVILSNAKKVKNNLNLFFEMILGWVEVEAKLAQNLWDTFFLCIPVVSTTLASASRLFPNTNENQIGWLLIDEAGQATPQSAVGIIHRSKRCVIVGDPLQVEPVVTIPANLVAKLRQLSNVDLLWSPLQTSVQQLADRISLSGTYMQNGTESDPIWTGFPLRTHRRCDEPMFSIANKIAYSDQMVKAVKENSKEIFIGASQWFHVENINPPINKHVIIEEIDLLKIKITELLNSGYSGNIYVISPFKSVAGACDNEFRKIENVFCGTVHKFQGKEADIVFLVLGSDPKSSGARKWASQKPNILNVALTRAKKRLYVIGNKKLWSQCEYYKEMNNVLSQN